MARVFSTMPLQVPVAVAAEGELGEGGGQQGGLQGEEEGGREGGSC